VRFLPLPGSIKLSTFGSENSQIVSRQRRRKIRMLAGLFLTVKTVRCSLKETKVKPDLQILAGKNKLKQQNYFPLPIRRRTTILLKNSWLLLMRCN